MQLSLKAMRVNRDMRQDEVAKKLGVTPATMCLYESGKRTLTREKIDILLKLYDCKYEDICFK